GGNEEQPPEERGEQEHHRRRRHARHEREQWQQVQQEEGDGRTDVDPLVGRSAYGLVHARSLLLAVPYLPVGRKPPWEPNGRRGTSGATGGRPANLGSQPLRIYSDRAYPSEWAVSGQQPRKEPDASRELRLRVQPLWRTNRGSPAHLRQEPVPADLAEWGALPRPPRTDRT